MIAGIARVAAGVDEVGIFVAKNRVVARHAVDGILVAAAVKEVIAVLSEDVVAAVLAKDLVVAGSAKEDVRAAVAIEDIVAGPADDQVALRPAWRMSLPSPPERVQRTNSRLRKGRGVPLRAPM